MKVDPNQQCGNPECANYSSTAATCCCRTCANKVSSNIAKQINLQLSEQKLAKFIAENPQPKCKNPNCDNLCYKLPRYYKWSKFCSKECKDSCVEKRGLLSPEKKAQSMKKRQQTCQEKYGTDSTFESKEIREKIKQTCQEKYGVNSPLESKEIRDKIKQTMKEKYGVEHPFQSSELIKKAKQTLLENYGVEHPLQNQEILERMKQTNIERYGSEFCGGLSQFVQKAQQTNLLKFGTRFPATLPSSIDNRKKVCNERYGGYSSYYLNYTELGKQLMMDENFPQLVELNQTMSMTEIALTHGMSLGSIHQRFKKFNVKPKVHYTSIFHKEILSFLTDIGIDNVSINRRDIIAPYEIDICINDKLLIECNGLFWHSELNIQDKNYHLTKTIKCEQKGKELIHIWQHDWDNKRDICKSIIKSKLGLYEQRIYGRQTKIKAIDKGLEAWFVTKNHIQGYIPSVVCYGLYYNDELVSIMSFGRSRFSSSYQWELLRFCSKLNTTIVGGANKLFSHFVNNHNPETIVSHCHRHLFSGDVYANMGFTFSHFSKPSYFYTKDYRKIYNRIMFQKHKLASILEFFDESKTEWENMQENGWDRIWDCGNIVFVWSNSQIVK